ncbi:MAG: diiron oxygenase [Acidimicrobiales bacterium]
MEDPMTVLDEAVTERVRRLSTSAARRLIEPDTDVPGEVGPGQVLADELLSVAGLDLDLTAEQRRILSREEVASITQAGIRFEAVLEAGFAAQIATATELTDPRLTFILHEVGEETRHQRLFQRLICQLAPEAPHPIPLRFVQLGYGLTVHATASFRAMFYALVLVGEEIPDLFQKVASEHPDTDPFVKAINRYHRQEEARHLSFARAVYPEIWARAGWLDRLLVRRLVPRIARGMFELMVHPGVYAAVGLPGFRTWQAANRTPGRLQWRREATRPVLRALLDAGAIDAGRVPGGWRSLCGVDRHGEPRPDLVPSWTTRTWEAAAYSKWSSS